MSIDELVLTAGHGVVGTLGDWLFKHTRRGRLVETTVENQGLFLTWLSVTALLIPFASATTIPAFVTSAASN